MDAILEFVFELIFEIVFEGSIETASSRRVPMPLRVLAGIFVLAAFGGVVFIIVFTGIMCFREPVNMPAVGVGLFLLAAFFTGAMIFRIAKFSRNRTR